MFYRKPNQGDKVLKQLRYKIHFDSSTPFRQVVLSRSWVSRVEVRCICPLTWNRWLHHWEGSSALIFWWNFQFWHTEIPGPKCYVDTNVPSYRPGHMFFRFLNWRFKHSHLCGVKYCPNEWSFPPLRQSCRKFFHWCVGGSFMRPWPVEIARFISISYIHHIQNTLRCIRVHLDLKYLKSPNVGKHM